MGVKMVTIYVMSGCLLVVIICVVYSPPPSPSPSPTLVSLSISLLTQVSIILWHNIHSRHKVSTKQTAGRYIHDIYFKTGHFKTGYFKTG